ncbi:hypothetical protein Lal_00037682 [Lupinus albus]|nr:hypothetical protein Lal_00037682 [Lupinus albus]
MFTAQDKPEICSFNPVFFFPFATSVPLLQPVDAKSECILKFTPFPGLHTNISHKPVEMYQGLGSHKAEPEPCFRFFLLKFLFLIIDLTVRECDSLPTLLPFSEVDEEDTVCNLPFNPFFETGALFPNSLGEETYSRNSSLLPLVLQIDGQDADVSFSISAGSNGCDRFPNLLDEQSDLLSSGTRDIATVLTLTPRLDGPDRLPSTTTELYNVCIFPTSDILGDAAVDFDNLFIAANSDALDTHMSLNACFKVTGSEVPTRGDRGTPIVIGFFNALLILGLVPSCRIPKSLDEDLRVNNSNSLLISLSGLSLHPSLSTGSF